MSEESKKWYQMTRPIFNSGFEDDEFWVYGQDGFQELLSSFIGSDVFIYDKTLDVEPQQIRAIIQQNTSDAYSGTTVRQILCNIGTLKCGQYVKCDGALWLVIGLPDNNRVYEKAVLWKCKYSIRFISPLTGKIVEYPVYSTNSTQYGTGETDKTQITVGGDQHLLYLPCNEEILMLDAQFRFLMDKNKKYPTAYRITKVDPISYAVGSERVDDGLIQWAVLEDQFNAATDNAELMIADYYTSDHGGTEETSGTDAQIVLTDLDGDFKIAVGERKQIRVQFLDSQGGSISPVKYRLEYDFAGAADVIDNTNDIIVLQASNDPKFVGTQIEIKAIDDISGSEAVIKIQVVNW